MTSIIRIIFILLQLTLFSASPVQSADITPLELFEGANKYETEAIAEGLTETILSNVGITKHKRSSSPIASARGG